MHETAESVTDIDAETLKQRQRSPSTTDHEEMPRCPNCGSVKLRHKTGGPGGPRKPGEYRCDGCNSHFDEPVKADDAPGGQADV
jgi:transposase-like protein